MRQLSRGTLDNRRRATEKLAWFLRERELPTCGTAELRAFFAYVNTAHELQAGRWGDPRRRRALRPVSVRSLHSILRAFFRFVVEEGGLAVSPMDRLSPPVARADQVRPFYGGTGGGAGGRGAPHSPSAA